MKKIFYTLLSLPLIFNAQVTLFEYDFDNLNVGNPLVLESGGPFETWSGGAGTTEDPIISSERVFSPPNSVHVFKTSNAAFHDFIIPFPNDLSWPSGTQSGAYEFKMKMYIPQNSGAYINLGGPWSGTSQFHHGMGIYFNADGTARSEFNETAQFTYPQNQWFDLSFIFDLTGTFVTSGQFHDTQLIINGVVKASEWVGLNTNSTIGAVDIAAYAYASNSSNSFANSNFFIDDIELIDLLGTLDVDYNEQLLPELSPNPSNGKFAINFNDYAFDNALMTITNMMGAVVYSDVLSTVSNSTQNFDLDLNSGVYLVKVNDNLNEFTTRVVIK